MRGMTEDTPKVSNTATNWGEFGEPPSMFTPEQELALRGLGRGTDEAR